MRILTLAISGLLAGAAHAGGDALVIGNSSYNGVQTLFAATQVAEAAEAMRAQGFEVTEARDAGGPAMKQGFGDFVTRLGEDDGPVVVMLAGAFLHGTAGAYLLPATDGAALGDAAVMVDAFPLDAALAVLTKYPGRAFLVLSESAVAAEGGDYLEPGLGQLVIPAGVTVLHGPEAAVSRFAASGLTKVGQPVVAAAQAAGLTVEGYTSGELVVVRPADVPTIPAAQAPAEAQPEATPVAEAPTAAAEEVKPILAEEVAPATPAPAPTPAPAQVAAAPEPTVTSEPEAEAAEQETIPETTIPLTPETQDTVAEAEPVDTRTEVQIAADDAAWKAARISNTEASYQAYLEAQPEGLYANAASQRIKAMKADPFYELRKAEDLLGLDREARRAVQRNLDALGHYHWAVDGIFGDGTRDAVRAWQKADNREPTGYLDLNQIAALDRQAGDQVQMAKQEEARRQQAAAAEAKRRRDQAAEAEAARKKAAEDAARQAAAEAPAVRPRPAGPSDAALWSEVERLGTEGAVRRYLEVYPNGGRATQARNMLHVIERMRRGS